MIVPGTNMLQFTTIQFNEDFPKCHPLGILNFSFYDGLKPNCAAVSFASFAASADFDSNSLTFSFTMS